MSIFYKRVRVEYVGYVKVEAEDDNTAERKATDLMFDEKMNDECYPAVEIEDYDPEELIQKAKNADTEKMFVVSIKPYRLEP